VVNIEANGTTVGAFVANMTTKSITGLTANTTYYYNVIAKDEAGNKASYSTKKVTTLVSSAPTVGDSGTILAFDLLKTEVTLLWTKATDETTSVANLQYLVYMSTGNNIDTIANIEANGTGIGTFAANISTRIITPLTANTTYYFNIVVKDELGNKAAYTMKQILTLNNSAPLTMSGSTQYTLVQILNLTATSVNPTWLAASDETTAQADLQYLVYYSTGNNIDTVANMEANGTAVGTYAVNITNKSVTGLSNGTRYYVNLIVKDEAGNKAGFNMNPNTSCRATASLTLANCLFTTPPPFHQDCVDTYNPAISTCAAAGN